jgi:hypothetical protein
MKRQRLSRIVPNQPNRQAIEYRRRSTRLQTGEAASANCQAQLARRWEWTHPTMATQTGSGGRWPASPLPSRRIA